MVIKKNNNLTVGTDIRNNNNLSVLCHIFQCPFLSENRPQLYAAYT